MARYGQMALEGFVGDDQVQAMQDELMELQARREAVSRSAGAVTRDSQAAQAEPSAALAQWRADQAQLPRSQAMQEQESTENRARKTRVVSAPKQAASPGCIYPWAPGCNRGRPWPRWCPAAPAVEIGCRRISMPPVARPDSFAPGRTFGCGTPHSPTRSSAWRAPPSTRSVARPSIRKACRWVRRLR